MRAGRAGLVSAGASTAACIIAFAAADARAQFACSTSGAVQTCVNTGTDGSIFSNMFTGAVTENSGTAFSFNAQSTTGDAFARNSGTASALFSASTGGGNVMTVNNGTAGTSNAFTSGGGNATNNNSGTLISGNMGASTSGGFGHATALNSGTIANGNLVVATGSGGDATTTNTASGVINGFAVAEAQAGGNGTLINAGSILGGEASARAFAGSASLTNSGRIDVTGNVFTLSGSGSGALNNTGTISAGRIRSLTGGGDATTNNAGTMVGRVEMQLTSGGNATLTNTGSVSSSSATAVTMSATAGFSTSIVNAGTITGVTGVSSSGVMFINNTGVITGTGGTAISTAGNLALTLGTGSVLNGNVQAGGTANSLNLFAGQGTEDSSLTGFQTISLNGGDWVLSGAVTSAGGTTVTGTGQLTISGVLGGGALTKTGPGTLILSGNNTYAGATIVDGGTLRVNGSQASAVTVNSGALLGGSGTIGGLSVGNGGTVAPGNSIGTLSVTGNVSFAAQSIYVVELNPQGEADRIVATGTATITGGTVQVQAETGFYRKDTRYTILTAQGGVIGTFTTLTTNFVFLDLSLVYDANNVYLNVNRNSVQFAQLAHTENQLAVGKALDVFALNPPSADATTVSNALFNLSEPQARAAYDQISGAAHGNLVMSSLTIRRMFGRALDDRLMQEQGSAAARASAAQQGNAQFALAGTAGQDFSPMLAAASATNGESRDTSSGWHTWVKGLGQFNNTSGDSNAQGYDLTIGGALLGADIMPLKGLRVGAAVGYAHGDFDGDNNSGAGGIDSYQGLIYGRYDHGRFFFADAQAGYAFNQYDLDRGISFGTINRTASSDADGHDVSAQLRIGAKLDSGGFFVVPSASLRYDRLQREGFTETGADSLNLSVESKSFTALRSSLGARASYPIKSNESGIELEPYAAAYWQHDFRNGAVPVEARFSGIGIDVHGTEVGRDAAVLQVGAAAVLDDRFTLFAGYDAELRIRQTDHAISAGLRYRW